MNLLIYGSGGFGREVLCLAERLGRYDKIAFINDYENNHDFRGHSIVSFNGALKEYPPKNTEVIVAVGEPKDRQKLYDKVSECGYGLATLISPTSVISYDVEIGEGTIISDFACVRPGARIGKNCIIHPNVVVGHDIKIGNHSVLSTNCSPGGFTVFGDRVYCGMNSTIKEKLEIGDDVVIAMGASVFRNVDAGDTVVGNPGRVTKGNLEQRVFK